MEAEHLMMQTLKSMDSLRYGVKVLPEIGEQHKTIWLIDWKNPENNDFGIAEEVTIRDRNNKSTACTRKLAILRHARIDPPQHSRYLSSSSL